MSDHHELPAVGGRRLDRSIADFERSCLVLLMHEQEKPLPDNAIVATLCDAVRLGREQCDMMAGPAGDWFQDNTRLKDKIAELERDWPLLKEQVRVSDEAFNFHLKRANALMEENNTLRTALKEAETALEHTWEIEEMGYTPNDPESESGQSTCNKCEGDMPHGGHAENCPQPLIEKALSTIQAIWEKGNK